MDIDFLASETVDEKLCEKILDFYDEAIELTASLKKRKNEKERLIQLDRWFHEQLPASINGRSPSSLNSDELVKLMEWKLSRGKWRPRLIDFAKSNPDEMVIKSSEAAFQAAYENDIEDAIEKLCTIKGVGPATASAILASGSPSKCCFFADEVAEVFIKGKLKYSQQEYLKLNEDLTAIANKLNEKINSKKWTPHRVELLIWTREVLKKLSPNSLDNI